MCERRLLRNWLHLILHAAFGIAFATLLSQHAQTARIVRIRAPIVSAIEGLRAPADGGMCDRERRTVLRHALEVCGGMVETEMPDLRTEPCSDDYADCSAILAPSDVLYGFRTASNRSCLNPAIQAVCKQTCNLCTPPVTCEPSGSDTVGLHDLTIETIWPFLFELERLFGGRLAQPNSDAEQMLGIPNYVRSSPGVGVSSDPRLEALARLHDYTRRLVYDSSTSPAIAMPFPALSVRLAQHMAGMNRVGADYRRYVLMGLLLGRLHQTQPETWPRSVVVALLCFVHRSSLADRRTRLCEHKFDFVPEARELCTRTCALGVNAACNSTEASDLKRLSRYIVRDCCDVPRAGMCANVSSREWLFETGRRYLGMTPRDDESWFEIFDRLASGSPDVVSKLRAAQLTVMLDNATTLAYAAANDYYSEWASIQSRGRFLVFDEVISGSYVVVQRRLMEPCGSALSDRTSSCRSVQPDTSNCCTPHGFLPALHDEYRVASVMKDLCPPFRYDPDFAGHVLTLPSSDPLSNYGFAHLTVGRLVLAQSLSLIDASVEQVKFITVLSNLQRDEFANTVVSVTLEIKRTGGITGSLDVQVPSFH
jgi:hypothetical protein